MTPNSTSGTSATAKVPFTAADLSVILDACRKNEVAALTLGDLHVSFYAPANLRGNGRELEPQGEETPQGQEVETPTAGKVVLTEEQKELLRDAKLSQLMAEDPLAYEQAVIDAEMRGEHDVEEDDRPT